MLFRFKIRFAFTVVLLLLGCVLTAPLVAGETPKDRDSAAGNAPLDDATIVEDAEKVAALEQARIEAAAKAKKKADLKLKLDTYPLGVTGILPFVEAKDEGRFGVPNQPDIPGKAGMGDGIRVVIPGLSEAAEVELIDPTKLVLFIDGRVFKGVFPESVSYDSVDYKLKRTNDAIDAWNGLLGSPSLEPIKHVAVSVGYADQKPLGLAKDSLQKNLDLIVYRKRWAVGSLIVLIVMGFVFWRYGGKDLVRDSGPRNPEPGKRPYSLAKVQVAWWFFLVVGCFLLIYLITGEFTMTDQALILIGIGTGTALGSAMIDNSKRGTADGELETLIPQEAKLKAEIEQLNKDTAALETAVTANQAAATDADKAALNTDKESLKAKKIEIIEKNAKLEMVSAKIADAKDGLTRPKSAGFWDDLVTDANGPSFHRFQMIAWTVILGILFLAGVYKNLAMPEFSGTMLALMGISAGTYLGFKIPERQNKGDETPESGAAAGPAEPGGAAGPA